MPYRCRSVVAIEPAGSCHKSAGRRGAKRAIAIADVTVIDVVSGAHRPYITVLVRNGRIEGTRIEGEPSVWRHTAGW